MAGQAARRTLQMALPALHGGRRHKDRDVTGENIAVVSSSHCLEHVRKNGQKKLHEKADVGDQRGSGH